MLSSKTLPEQNFGELAESENSRQSSPKTIKSSSALSFEELQSFIMEEVQIRYEVIENYGTSKNQHNLIKIINESDVQNQNNFYCIIVNFNDELLKQKIKTEISRYSFETKYFDFTDWKDQKDSLVLSDSTSTTEPQSFRDYVSINSQFCRVIVFSQEFDLQLIDIIHNYPYNYYCTDAKLVKEEYLEGLKLHQQFQLIEMNYSKKSLVLLIQNDQTFNFDIVINLSFLRLSRLKDIKFAGIQIKGCIDYVDNINQIKIHPQIEYQKIGKKKILFNYNMPFMVQKQQEITISQLTHIFIVPILSNFDLYLPLPLQLSSNIILLQGQRIQKLLIISLNSFRQRLFALLQALLILKNMKRFTFYQMYIQQLQSRMKIALQQSLFKIKSKRMNFFFLSIQIKNLILLNLCSHQIKLIKFKT